MSVDDQWTAKIKETMAVDVQRFRDERLPSREIINRLFEIPEVAQAFALRANRRRPLPAEPSTDAERFEVIEALTHVADWLGSDFDEDIAERLREIAGELAPP